MKIIQKSSSTALGKTRKQNEDRIGDSEFGAWIIDGVTKITDYHLEGNEPNEVRWFVDKIHQALKKNIDDLSKPISTILKNEISRIRDQFHFIAVPPIDGARTIPSEAWPSASIIVVRVVGLSIEWFSLGDCIAYIEAGPQAILVEHHESRTIQSRRIEQIKSELEKVGTNLSFQYIRKNIIEPILIEERKQKIAPRVLTLDSSSVNYAKTGSIETSQANMILMSDGYTRAVDIYDIFPSYHDLLQASIDSGIRGVIESIRNSERKDSECVLYPRLKVSDDTSAILITHNIENSILSSEEWMRLRKYGEKLHQAEPFTLEEAKDMQSLSARSKNQPPQSDSLWLTALLGVAAGVAIGVLGKIAYDFIVKASKDESDEDTM